MSDTLRIVLAALSGFILTFVLLYFLPFGKTLLGHDRGRKYVEGSEVNIGKPTGVGIYFSLVLTIVCACFCKGGTGVYLILILTFLMSVIGFLDDRSATPWGEYSKGALDFVVGILAAIAFVRFLGSSVVLGITGSEFIVNPILYAILAVILFVVSINATNATDGVDGLSGTLAILSVLTLIAASYIRGTLTVTGLVLCVSLIFVLAAYLIFNRYPSKMLMGDAGSRAVGFFLAFLFMYLKLPFAYLIVGLPFLLDGGLSILKITIGRLTHKKIIILKNIVTPVHDHLKKKLGFSVPKTRAVICLIALVIDVIYVALASVVGLS